MLSPWVTQRGDFRPKGAFLRDVNDRLHVTSVIARLHDSACRNRFE